MNFTQRFNGFNLKQSFTARTGALFFCILALGLFCGNALEAGSKPPDMALRFHLQASAGMPPEQTVAVNLIDPPQVVQVGKLPEMTEKHLEWIERTPDGKILIVFNTIGANLLDAATSSHMGAIMVVICNGRVVYAPVIDVPLRTGKIVIPEGITDQEILAFQKMIAKKKKT